MVGANGTQYTPANITAAIGDTVTFVFVAGNHTVTQSTFAEPCVRSFNASTSQSGFDSGFNPVIAQDIAVPAFTISVISTTPIWFYCRQTGHCGKGMVGAINAVESGNKSYEAFKALAMATNGTAPAVPSGTVGGNGSPSASATGAGMKSVVGRAGAALALVGLAAGLFL